MSSLQSIAKSYPVFAPEYIRLLCAPQLELLQESCTALCLSDDELKKALLRKEGASNLPLLSLYSDVMEHTRKMHYALSWIASVCEEYSVELSEVLS